MTRRDITRRVAASLAMSTALLAWATAAGAATMPQIKAPKALAENAALAPRFDPKEPTKVDEFVQEKDVRSVHFAYDKSALRSSDRQILASDARWLKEHTPYEVLVQGYADDRGTKPYNVALAKRRAMVVKNALVARGIQPDRITMVSYGEARPECHAKTKSESCFSKNRRADILVRRATQQSP